MFGARLGKMGSGGGLTPVKQAIALLRRKSATLWLPGLPNNFLDSAGVTAATVDNPVGKVKDATGVIDASQATTANKPALRRGVVNLLTYSSQLDNASWTKINATASANATTAPDGSLTADKMVETATTSEHYIVLASAVSIPSGVSMVCSFYIKAAERSAFRFYSAAGFSNMIVFFDTVGVTATITGGGSNAKAATITSVGNGWYRCTVSDVSAAVSINPQVNLVSTGTTVNYLGDITKGAYIWGAQLETGSIAHDYVPTTTAPASSTQGPYWLDTAAGAHTLGATIPTGYESSIVIDAVTNVGATVLTGQNLTGAYSVYGGISATELVTGGSPLIDASWTKGAVTQAAPTISGGKTSLNWNGGGDFSFITQLISVTAGKNYLVTANYSGAGGIQAGLTNGAIGLDVSSTGTSVMLAAVTGDTTLVVTSNSGTIVLGSVVVREVLPGTSGRIILPGTIAVPASLTAGEQALLVGYANRQAGI